VVIETRIDGLVARKKENPFKTTKMAKSTMLKIEEEEGEGHKMVTPLNRKVRKQAGDKAETTEAVEVDEVEVGAGVARTQSEDVVINKAQQRTSSALPGLRNNWRDVRDDLVDYDVVQNPLD
jgi:hypothetical protein